MSLIFLYAVCLIVGALIGMSGVGGILIPPALILLSGLDVHTAMGTALASFLPLGMVGTWMYGRKGFMDWNLALPFMLGGLTALPGALLNAHTDARPLVATLACVILFAGLCSLRPPAPGKGAGFWQARAGVFCIGAASGLMAGLTGAGGPVLTIPWMIVGGISPLTAVALSMPYQVVTSLCGSLGNVAGGHVNFAMLPYICGFETLGFAGGVAVAVRTPAAVLRRIVGGLCCGLGLFLLLRSL